MTSDGSERWRGGYSRAELDRAQQIFGLAFPPDLVALLRDRRPVDGHDFTDEAAIRRMLEWPFEGLPFDVEHKALWWAEWGERPASPDARREILHSVVARAPRLIPLIAHRFLPAQPAEAGNPVFSVYGSDVIHYGTDLADYFDREFLGWDHRPWPGGIKHIPFWSNLVQRNC